MGSQLLIRCRRSSQNTTRTCFSEGWLQTIHDEQKTYTAAPDQLQIGYCMTQHDEQFFESQHHIFRAFFESFDYPGKNEPKSRSQNYGLGTLTKSLLKGNRCKDDPGEIRIFDPSTQPSHNFTNKTANAVDFEWMTIPQFSQDFLPKIFIEIRNEFHGDERLQIGKDMDFGESLVEDQNELQLLRGCAIPFPNLETYYGFLSMISNGSAKEINDTNTISFFAKAFKSWYPCHRRRCFTSVDILGRIDFDISDPLKECKNLLNPKNKKCIIAFKCYSV